MLLGKFEPLSHFDIWQPRWHDKVVLLNAKKVRDAKTKFLKITFSKAPTMEGDWVISRTKAMSYPKDTNGTIQCYTVPLSELQVLEINPKDMRGVI